MKKEFDYNEMLGYMKDDIVDYYVVKQENLDYFSKTFKDLVTKNKTFDGYVVFKDSTVR